MTCLRPDAIGAEVTALASAISTGIALGKSLQQAIDRKLGYFGEARFVCFHYELRGQEVMWRDTDSYGFGCGGWMAYFDEIEPVARSHGVSLGNQSEAGDHVLLVDRVGRHACFTYREEAQEFLARRLAVAC